MKFERIMFTKKCRVSPRLPDSREVWGYLYTNIYHQGRLFVISQDTTSDLTTGNWVYMKNTWRLYDKETGFAIFSSFPTRRDLIEFIEATLPATPVEQIDEKIAAHWRKRAKALLAR